MSVNFSSTTPAAPSGNTNVTFNSDGNGNVSASVPVNLAVAAAVSLTTQNANIGATTLLAPSASGRYRISAYAIVTTVDGASSTLPKVTITWTDPDNSAAQSFDITPTNGGNLQTTLQQATMFLSAKAATNIQYATSGYTSGTPGVMKYSLYIRIEGAL